MKTDRAIDDTPPRPAWTAPFRWIARLARVSLFDIDFEEETSRENANLWLLFLASDPEGTWHLWPDTARRLQLDDPTD
jgi:hypothetical protein